MSLHPLTTARATTSRSNEIIGLVATLLLASACRKPDSAPPEGEAPAKGATAQAAPAATEATPAGTSSESVPAAAASAPAASPSKLVPATFDKTVPAALATMTHIEGCSLDQIGGHSVGPATRVSTDQPLGFTGWAADVKTATVPPVIIVELEGPARYFAPAFRITKRADVAQAFKQPALVDAGYDALLSFAGVAPGTYSVKVDSVTASGAALQCDTQRKLEVP